MKKRIFIVLLTGIFYCLAMINLSVAQTKINNCRKEVLGAKLKMVSPPKKINTVSDFILLPNDNELLCKFNIWYKLLLYRERENVFRLREDYFGNTSAKTISPDEANEIVSLWRNLSDSAENVQMHERKNVTEISKGEFGLYDIKKKKWKEISWDQGKEMLEKHRRTRIETSIFDSIKIGIPSVMVHDKAIWSRERGSDKPILRLTPKFKYGVTRFMASPDGKKIVYEVHTREKFDLGKITGWATNYITKSGICCVNGDANKLFHLNRFGESCNWSSDSSFAVSFFEKKFRFIFFGKAK